MLIHALQVGGTEWIWIVFLVVFFLFGSKKMPELARAFGKAMNEFQRGREEIEREFRLAVAPSPSPRPTTADLKTSPAPTSNLVKAAADMGLNVKDKGDEDLRKEMMEFLGGKSGSKAEGSSDKQKTNTDLDQESQPSSGDRNA